MADWVAIAIFLPAVALGAWTQATSGFALGLVVMALVQLSGAMSLADAAAAISVLAFVNIAVVLWDSYRDIDKNLFLCLVIGQLPAIGIGVWLLNYLGREAALLLELIFGLFLVVGSISLTVNPTPKSVRSSQGATVGIGFAGGIFGGMFAASGPVVGWFAYRQPVVLASIRASLLAMLGLTTVARTIIVTIDGIFTQSLIITIICSIPVVFWATWFAKRYPPKLTDRQFRRMIFMFVLIIGIWISSSSVLQILRIY